MEKIAVLAIKVARAKAKSALKQIYKTHENNQDESTKLDAAIMSSLSNALLDDMDKLDAKLDALCKAPMKTSQQYFNTALNALFNSHHNTGNDVNKTSKICDEYFNLSYQKAQEGFHTVQDASDKIICGRIAMMAAIFAFRNNIPLLLNEIRLRFLDILSDYNVQITLKSYHDINASSGVSIKKLWTSKNKIHEYKQIVFDIVQLYHLLTTQLSSNLMITNNFNDSNIQKIKCVEKNKKQKQIEYKNNDENDMDEIDEKKEENKDRFNNSNILMKYKQKSPFSSGSWLLLGVPKCFEDNKRNKNISIGIISQSKLSLSTTEAVQTVQSLIQHCLTKFILFSGYTMSYKQYDKFVEEYCNQFGGKKNKDYNHNMYDNEMIYNLNLMSTRGIKDQPNMIMVENRALIIHSMGLKHWNLATFLCKYYPLNILQFNTHNRWTPLIYAIIDDKIELIRLICDIWENQLKYQMDIISIKLQQKFVGNDFNLLTHCDEDGCPSLLFCHSIESIDILCNNYNVDINYLFKKKNQTILICCVHRCLYDVIEYILNTYYNKIKVNIQNISGNSAFMNTFRKIRNGNVKMIQIFLKWNEKHKQINWKLTNKQNQNAFDLLKDAKDSINDDKMYQNINNEMTKQSSFL